MEKYEFDKENFDFRRVGRTFWNILETVSKWIIGSATLAAVYYIVSSFFFSTDLEKSLIRENKMYSEQYSKMLGKQKLIEDVVQDLQSRDNKIYETLFRTDAPSIDPGEQITPELSFDDAKNVSVVKYSENKINNLKEKADKIETDFQQVFSILCADKNPLPPMSSPIEDITYSKIGASSGIRLNPFYKVMYQHNGLDIIASQYEPVFASAEGTVSKVIRSSKGLGNIIEINHNNGYITKYCQLGNIYVSAGQKVPLGYKIADVGVSGRSFAPHLHYEVHYNGEIKDPVNFLFASLEPMSYFNVMCMSVSTEQSLD